MDRISKIVEILLDQQQPVTFDFIAEQMSVSNKTVRNDIKKVEEYLSAKGAELNKKPGIGICIQCSNEVRHQIFQEIGSRRQPIEPFSPQARKFYILKRLLMSDGQLTTQELADELYVSRVTLYKDLPEVERWLKQFDLRLLSKTNYGIQVVGQEENWRNAVASLIANDKEQAELKEMLYEHYGGRLDYKTLLKLKELISLDFKQIERIVSQAEQQLAFHFSDESYASFIIHIAIAIKRLKSKKDIFLSDTILEQLRQKPEYPIAQEMAQGIQDAFDVTLPQSEVGYILLHLLGAKMNQEEMDVEWETEESSLATLLAKEIIQIAGNVLGMDFSNDRQFLNGLILHLRPTVNRLKYGLSLKNPIISEIKENYPEVYGVAWMTSIIFEKYVGKRVNEEEIGYIALHIGAAVERGKKPFRVLVVCASGIGTSQLLAARLKRSFKEFDIAAVMSATTALEHSLADIDFIISTVGLSSAFVAKPVVCISPLLTQKDIKKLEEFLQCIQEKNSHSKSGGIFMLINEKLITLDIKAKTKEEVIRQLATVAEGEGKITSVEEYVQDVLEREKSFSTGVGNGIAIPHSKSNAVKEAMIVFGRLSADVDWEAHDGNPVDMVFMLGVPSQNVDNVHLKILSKLSVQLMDEEFVELLRKENSAQGILRVLSKVQVD